MSQALSITTLYSYNLFADDYARTKGKGKSLICGDDSIRAGDREFIESYKRKIEELGGIWSKTKDVTGSHGNGIFTEQHFSGATILAVPKVKAFARVSTDNIPLWIKAVQTSLKIELPGRKEESLPYRQGLEELLYPFEEEIEYLSEILPIGLPKALGGLGNKYPLHWTTKNILASSQGLQDRLLELKIVKTVAKGLNPKTINLVHQRKVRIQPEYPSSSESAFSKAVGYVKGTHRWLYLEEQALKSAIEGAVALEDPALPIRFPYESNEARIRDHLTRLSKVKDKLIEANVYGKTELNIQRVIHQSYQFDVPVNIVRDIIGSVVVNRNYNL